MNYFRPPSVGGWTAYYQAPSFTRLWMNSSYVKLRFDVAAYLLTDGFKSNVDNSTIFTINVIDYVQGLSNPKSAPQIVDDTVLVFCPKGLGFEEFCAFKLKILFVLLVLDVILKGLFENGLLLVIF
jgi:hypothetical protein